MKFDFKKVKKRLNSNTTRSAMIAVGAKVGEKFIHDVSLWWASVIIGIIAIFFIGFFASDEVITEKSEES